MSVRYEIDFDAKIARNFKHRLLKLGFHLGEGPSCRIVYVSVPQETAAVKLFKEMVAYGARMESVPCDEPYTVTRSREALEAEREQLDKRLQILESIEYVTECGELLLGNPHNRMNFVGADLKSLKPVLLEILEARYRDA